MIPVEDMQWCRWCRETKPADHKDCVTPCTCPPEHDEDWHAPECAQFEDCGGWRVHDDPPCGGCDSCLMAINAYYARPTEEETP